MDIFEALAARRSIKRFLDLPVTPAQIEGLLDAAILAPNFRLTRPWRFYVLGPESRAGYGLALGERKARKVQDPEAARAVRERTVEEYRTLPAMLAVAMVVAPDPAAAEEDFAAVMMAMENFLLAAVAMGLGTHVRTGAVMNDPAARTAVGVPEGERVVATVSLGVPADLPPARAYQPAAVFTTWRE